MNAIKVGIVGAGHRALKYASYSLNEPEKMQIKAIAEPDKVRRDLAATKYNIDKNYCFNTADELAEAKPDLDAVINGTMDQYHISTTIPLLRAGYNVLLEKPICNNKNDLMNLWDIARKYDRKVMICHVLRYAPINIRMKEILNEGLIGDIKSIQTVENVSYHHMATAFVRGKWSNSDVCGSPMLLSKCCHDIDLITWLKSGVAPVYVSSFGGLKQYTSEHAPCGSGKRCLVDCQIEDSCSYSAKKLYIDNKLWNMYAWESIEYLGENKTDEQKIESLKNDNPYGKCVWQCENNVVDHQSVIIEFEDGTVATHNMNTGTAESSRLVHIIGLKGEIICHMDKGFLYVRYPSPDLSEKYYEQKFEFDDKTDMHAGGDFRLAADFVSSIKDEAPSISCTSLDDSIYGHLIEFAADESMRKKRIVKIDKIR